MINERISAVTELAHRLDVAIGNHADSYVDTYMADECVFDMQEIDVDVGFAETDVMMSPESSPKDEDASKSSCYQSASSDCSWNDLSPGRPADASKALEQLDMKPMQDFRDYVNFTPTATKLYLHTCTPSVGDSASAGSVGGLSPNSSEDSGFGTGLRSAARGKLFVKPEEPVVPVSATLVNKTTKMDDTLLAGTPRYRNSICYARSASCDSLF